MFLRHAARRSLVLFAGLLLAGFCGCSDSTDDPSKSDGKVATDSKASDGKGSGSDAQGGDSTAPGDDSAADQGSAEGVPSYSPLWGETTEAEGCVTIAESAGIVLDDPVDQDEITLQVKGTWLSSDLRVIAFGTLSGDGIKGYVINFIRADGDSESEGKIIDSDASLAASVHFTGSYAKGPFYQYIRFNRKTKSAYLWAPNDPLTSSPKLKVEGTLGEPLGTRLAVAGVGIKICTISF